MQEAHKMKQLHVVMFPWLAYGHILPFLELSKRLANQGIKVSFLSTPRNIAKISEMGLVGQNIDLLELPLPSMDGLPAGAESTADVPNEMADILKVALDGLEKPFHDLLQRISPDFVIYDFSQYWAATVAADLGMPSVLFVVFSAASSGYFLAPCRGKEINTVEDLASPPPDYPSSEIVFHQFEARHVYGAFNGNKGDLRVVDRFLKSIEGSTFVAIRSCVEMEAKFIQYLERATGKLVVPVGPLGPQNPVYDKLAEEESYCLRWMDKQAPRSVLYVSLGSECFLSKEQMGELALGLEATTLPFLWVLRSPGYLNNNNTNAVATLLPEGFEQRTRERGVIFSGWTPHLQILGHPSLGAFMCHSGWGFVMESVKFGVKLVVLPMNADQGLIARLVARELKIGVEVEREEDGSFRAEQIRRAVAKVMNEEEEEGREVKLRMDEIGEKIFGESGCEERCIHHFINRLRVSAT